MKLSDLNPSEISPVSATTPVASGAPVEGALKLSDLEHSDIESLPGGRLEEEYGGPTGALAAGAAHVVSSALPYAGIKGMEAIGLGPEKYQKLTEANPIASGIGDLAGFIRGPQAALNAGNAVGKLATAGSVAERALQFGTEGALLGATNVANEAALGDPNLNAQKIFSEIGFNTALGVGLGPVAKAFEVVVPAATKKLVSSLDDLKTSVFGTAENPTSVAKMITNAGATVSDKGVSDYSTALFHGLEAGDAKVAMPKLTKNLGEIHSAAEKTVTDLEEAVFPKVNPNEPIKNFHRPGAPLFHVADPAEDTIVEALGTHKLATKEFEAAFMEKSKDGFRISPTKVESFFSKTIDPETKAAQSEVLNSFINSSKAVADLSENHAAFKDAEKSISSHISELADEHRTVRDALEAMSNKAEKPKASSELVHDLGLGAIAHMVGVPHSLSAAALAGLKAYKTLQNPYTMGKTIGRTFEKLKVMADIADKVGGKMNSLAKGIFSNPAARGTLSPKMAMPIPAAASSDRKRETQIAKVQKLMVDPMQLQEHLAKQTEAFYDVAPQTASAIHQTIMSAVQFLDSKIPRPNSELPLSPKWKPSKAQAQQFSTYLETIEDPLSVLKKVKNGTLTRHSVEALEAVMPQMLNEMRMNVSQHLEGKKAMNLPYAVKLSLGKFLGTPLDESMLPSVMASNQLVFAQPDLSQQNTKKRASTSGMKEMTLAQRSKTQTQDDESRTD